MKLSKMSKEELEQYSYTDLAAMILKEEKKSLNTPTIFKKICDLLGLSDEDYANKIGDFYTTLTTDKTFILLDDATWDLRDRHSVKVTLNEEDTEDEEDLTETEDELDDGKKALEVLGGKLIKDEELTLPESEEERTLVLVQKVKSTPKKYPRQAGTPRRKPIH